VVGVTVSKRSTPEGKTDGRACEDLATREAIPMKQSTRDEAMGKVHELKGKVKEKAGRLTNNPNLEAEGQGEKIAGKVQKKIGQVEKVFEK
jgi:uncharacterized protein YjbJ (UPF0337 family)